MQMMHADVFGFLVPFTVALHKSCALGTREESAVFLCTAAILSNLNVLPLPADEEGAPLLTCLCSYEA